MKILYVIDWPIDSIGGSQKSTYTIATELQKKGNEIYLCCPRGNTNLGYGKIKYLYHNIYENTILDKIKKIIFYKKIIKLYKFDIVHIQNPTSFSLIGIMLLLNKRLKRKTKYIFTDRDFFSAYKEKQKYLFKLISKNFEYIICTTNQNKKQWDSIFDRVFVIPNVLDFDWYKYDERKEMQIKNQNDMSNYFVLGFASRFIKYKRWDSVYEICNELKNRDIKFAFVFGTATDEEDREAEKFIKKLDQIIYGRYICLKNVNSEKMKEFYYLIDCFILTSEKESFGRTLLEAMTKKNVVLGTNSGGVPDVIHNEDFLFEVGEIKTVVKVILDYLDNPMKLKKDKEYFYKYVQTKFSTNIMIEKHIEIYKKIMNCGENK